VFNRHTYHFEQVEIHTIEFGDFDITAYLSLLNQEEREKVERFILPKRKREFIATRLLKHELFPDTEILYNELGAPHLSSGPYISISHAPGVAGIAFCRDYPIGFDLEPIREKVHRIKDKFLHSTEKQFPDSNDTEALITIWSAKESLYKLMGEEGVIFAEDLYVEFLESPHLIGHYCQSGNWNQVKMTTFRQGETLLTVTGSHVQRT
jgi:4'-phosphopantetheinyl transferase